jgi:Uma2 family endonuclease
MAVHSPRRKLTYEDFVRIPEDLFRHEILDGEHVVSPAPSEAHQDCLGELYLEIGLYLRDHPGGKVLFAPFDVLLSEHDVVEPDLLFVSSARLGILTGKYALGAPDLVVEVLSPSTRRRDLGKKRARYELLGVGEYWILDPQRRTATVLRRQGEAFLPPLHLSAEAGDRLVTPLLPGLEIPLSGLFRR